MEVQGCHRRPISQSLLQKKNQLFSIPGVRWAMSRPDLFFGSFAVMVNLRYIFLSAFGIHPSNEMALLPLPKPASRLDSGQSGNPEKTEQDGKSKEAGSQQKHARQSKTPPAHA